VNRLATRSARDRALLALLLLWPAACTVGPDYKSPQIDTPQAFTESGGGVSSRPAEEGAWWQHFKDPVLSSLVERAAQNNLDLALAEARLREARAARRGTASELEPKIDAAGSYTRRRIASNTIGGNFGSGSFQIPSTQVDLYQVGFDASWELDLWGRVRRQVEAAEADIEAFSEAKREAVVALVGEVARNYVELRGAQRQRGITQENLRSQEQTLELVRAKHRAGLVSEIDVARALALVASTRAQLPSIETQEHNSIHRLGVLLGQAPGALMQELSQPAPIPVAPAEIATGLPGDLLRRRPDLRRAERELCAANARIGAAIADRYPRFSILGNLRFGSTETNNLFENNSLGWSIGPSVTWPLFDGGRIEANIEVQSAREEQALIRLRQAFLNALVETEDNVVIYGREQTRRQSLEEAVSANSRAVELANQLYTQGLTDYLAVLEAQRSLLAAQADLARSDTSVSLGAVALYKSLGGGW